MPPVEVIVTWGAGILFCVWHSRKQARIKATTLDRRRVPRLDLREVRRRGLA